MRRWCRMTVLESDCTTSFVLQFVWTKVGK
jgi:hypothetical protein